MTFPCLLTQMFMRLLMAGETTNLDSSDPAGMFGAT